MAAVEGMNHQMQLERVINQLLHERLQLTQAELELTRHKTQMIENLAKNMNHLNNVSLEMLDYTTEKIVQSQVDQLRNNIRSLENTRILLRRQIAHEARIAELVRMEEEQRIAEQARMEEERRIAQQERLEWEQASFFYKPVVYGKSLYRWFTSRRQGKKQRKARHSTKKITRNTKK